MEKNLLTNKQVKTLSNFIYSYLNEYIKVNENVFKAFLNEKLKEKENYNV